MLRLNQQSPKISGVRSEVVCETSCVDEQKNTAMRTRHELEAWNLKRVRDRAVKDGHYKADDIERIEGLYKAFMFKAAMGSGGLLVDPEMDEFWHTHLLFTRDYAAMCQKIAGRFIHHEPFDESEDCATEKCGPDCKSNCSSEPKCDAKGCKA
jgi:hypothetical protein